MSIKPPFLHPDLVPDEDSSADGPYRQSQNDAAHGVPLGDEHGGPHEASIPTPGGIPLFFPGNEANSALFSGADLFSAEGIPGVPQAEAPAPCPQCARLKKEADEARLRALADLDNARKRLAREKEEFTRYATENVLNDIIPSLDNLDLALQHASASEACKNFVIGVDMTKKLLLDSLAKHGLEAIGAVSQPFDPAIHEAVGTEANPDIPVDHVSSLLTRGYSLHGRLLRPARVIVCKK